MPLTVKQQARIDAAAKKDKERLREIYERQNAASRPSTNRPKAKAPRQRAARPAQAASFGARAADGVKYLELLRNPAGAGSVGRPDGQMIGAMVKTVRASDTVSVTSTGTTLMVAYLPHKHKIIAMADKAGTMLWSKVVNWDVNIATLATRFRTVGAVARLRTTVVEAGSTDIKGRLFAAVVLAEEAYQRMTPALMQQLAIGKGSFATSDAKRGATLLLPPVGDQSPHAIATANMHPIAAEAAITRSRADMDNGTRTTVGAIDDLYMDDAAAVHDEIPSNYEGELIVVGQLEYLTAPAAGSEVVVTVYREDGAGTLTQKQFTIIIAGLLSVSINVVDKSPGYVARVGMEYFSGNPNYAMQPQSFWRVAYPTYAPQFQEPALLFYVEGAAANDTYYLDVDAVVEMDATPTTKAAQADNATMGTSVDFSALETAANATPTLSWAYAGDPPASAFSFKKLVKKAVPVARQVAKTAAQHSGNPLVQAGAELL